MNTNDVLMVVVVVLTYIVHIEAKITEDDGNRCSYTIQNPQKHENLVLL